MEKVIDLEDRIPSFKEKRRKRTNVKFTILITIFVLVIFVLLYFQSSISNIKKIQISGEVIRDELYYEEQLGIQKGDSMWGFKPKEVEVRLEKISWVKEVKVKRELLNTVIIDITEWAKVAYIAEDGSFYPVLENGEVLRDEVKLVPIDAPIFNAVDDEKLRKRLIEELSKLEKEVLSMISQVTFINEEEDKYAVKLFMNDGYEVRGDLTTLAEKLNYYPSIVAQIGAEQDLEKGIIDVEVGTYYKAYSDVYVDFSNSDLKDTGEIEQWQDDGEVSDTENENRDGE